MTYFPQLACSMRSRATSGSSGDVLQNHGGDPRRPSRGAAHLAIGDLDPGSQRGRLQSFDELLVLDVKPVPRLDVWPAARLTQEHKILLHQRGGQVHVGEFLLAVEAVRPR